MLGNKAMAGGINIETVYPPSGTGGEPTGGPHGEIRGARPPAGYAPDDRTKWADRMVGVGSLLTLLFEITFLILNRRFLSLGHPWVLIFHLLNISLFATAVILTLRVGPWMRAHWKYVAFSFSSVFLASSTGITMITGETQPLFIAIMLFLAGTGPFLAWGEKTQALLSIVAFVAFGVAIKSLPTEAFNPYECLGVLIAAAIGLFSTALERRLRRARRQAEDEVAKSRETLVLQERVRLAGQLASGIAHDLNNTLNVIKLRLAVLAQDEAVRSGHAARLQAIDHAIEDATRTVARVRELGKRREGSLREPVQLREIIAQAIDLARSSIEGRSSSHGAFIKITSQVPDSLPAVKGPASDLRQVFLNLLLNARDAIERRGEIKVESTVEQDAVVVRVSDDGAGIPVQHLARIFEPFFTTKGPRGTGLGLSIARDIMEGAGGSISAANRPGSGAVFELRFPMAAVSDQENEPAANEHAAGGCRFLLIDDDLENLESLKESLNLKGCEADTALSGAEAVAKLRSAPAYDVILCDLSMPGMSGWEVARQAREIAGNASFYIVTGWGRQIEREIPPSVSVSGVLSKPIDLNEIGRIIATARTRNQRLEIAGSARQISG
jgi:signal transduction histidine kinase/ActR/RegA family two-component response regulator